MPIYAYACSNCGYAKDVLQKMSDPKLTQCPECKQETFEKQVTAAGFQLKGSGWYVTDFREKGNSSNSPATSKGKESKTESATAKSSDSATASKTESATASTTSSSSDSAA